MKRFIMYLLLVVLVIEVITLYVMNIRGSHVKVLAQTVEETTVPAIEPTTTAEPTETPFSSPELLVEAASPTPIASPKILPQAGTPTPLGSPKLSVKAATSMPTSTPIVIPTPTPLVSSQPTATAATPISRITYTSEQINSYIDRFGAQYGVDPHYIRSIALCESGFNANAVNGPYAGLFQWGSGSWATYRRLLGEDASVELRFNAEEAVQTSAYALSLGRSSLWPNCN